jgi:hypothetical protein
VRVPEMTVLENIVKPLSGVTLLAVGARILLLSIYALVAYFLASYFVFRIPLTKMRSVIDAASSAAVEPTPAEVGLARADIQSARDLTVRVRRIALVLFVVLIVSAFLFHFAHYLFPTASSIPGSDYTWRRYARGERDELQYRTNLLATFKIKYFELHEANIFRDLSWNLEPGVNSAPWAQRLREEFSVASIGRDGVVRQR